MKALMIALLMVGSFAAQAQETKTEGKTVEQCRSEIISTYGLDEDMVADEPSEGDGRATGWRELRVEAQDATNDYADSILMCVQKNVVTTCVLSSQDTTNASYGSCEL